MVLSLVDSGVAVTDPVPKAPDSVALPFAWVTLASNWVLDRPVDNTVTASPLKKVDVPNPESVTWSPAASVLAAVKVATLVAIDHAVMEPVKVLGKVAEVTAVPVAMVTRLGTVAIAFAMPVCDWVVLRAPKLSALLRPPTAGVKYCPSAYAVAAVVTSLMVMKVLELRLPQFPRAAASMILAFVPVPRPGFPPYDVM